MTTPDRQDDKCGACGIKRRDHSYSGGAYGVCGKFVEPQPDRQDDGLLPCPFCGGEADYYQSNEAVFSVSWIGHVVHCKTCQSRVQTTTSQEKAVKMWNARTPCREAAEGSVSPRDALRSICKAGGDLGCSCADQNYQWFDQGCKECIAKAYKLLLAA